MPRFFLEVAYKGTCYSGFQVQQNANTIQAEIEKAWQTIHRIPVSMTGSSRTDAGVHAAQNFFHFDADTIHPQALYKLNAVLPDDIVVKNLYPVKAHAHSRFDAISRTYQYRIHQTKDPFLKNLSLFYPYRLEAAKMHEAAALIGQQNDFTTFSKAHTQVHNFNCVIYESAWAFEKDAMVYTIKANRFLRGMVRMLVASMLRCGRGQLTLTEVEDMFDKKERCAFAARAEGLYLMQVAFSENYLVNDSNPHFNV